MIHRSGRRRRVGWWGGAAAAVLALGTLVAGSPPVRRAQAVPDAPPAPEAVTSTGVRLMAGGIVRVRATTGGSLAVAGTITITGAVADGFATVYPCAEGLPDPLTSNINFVAGTDVANAFFVKSDARGDICVWTSASAHVLVDEVAESSAISPHNAVRKLDTRQVGGKVVPGEARSLHVTDLPGQAVIGNLTVAGTTADGYATIYPCLNGTPATSNVNFVAGKDAAAAFVTRADAQGNVCIVASAPTDVIVDVAAETVGFAPSADRLVDTREGGTASRRRAGDVVTVHTSAGAGRAVIGTLTIAGPAAAGFATIYGCLDGKPETSNVNFPAGRDVANLFVTRTDANGDLCVVPSADAHVIVDLVGPASLFTVHRAVRQLDTREGFVHVYDGFSDEGQDIFLVETSTANYSYQKIAGGFSSITDPTGVDWLNYHPYGGGRGNYRGLPQLGPCCHPGYPSADEGVAMTTTIVEQSPNKVVMRSVAGGGAYDVTWTFRPTYATLTVNNLPSNYWMVYEGTPGGEVGAEDYWVQSDGKVRGIFDYLVPFELPDPEWVYFADGALGRSMFLAHHENDDLPDTYIGVGPGEMVVLGFMRAGNDPTYKAPFPQHLSVGLVTSTSYFDVAASVQTALSGG